LLKLPLQKTVKSVALMHDGQLHLLLVRGDHALNEIKASKVVGAFCFAREKEIVTALGCKPGSIGPVGVKGVKVIADRTVAAMSDFVCGANEEGFHPPAVHWGRDRPHPH